MLALAEVLHRKLEVSSFCAYLVSRLPLDRRVTVPVVGCAGADVFSTPMEGPGPVAAPQLFPMHRSACEQTSA